MEYGLLSRKLTFSVSLWGPLPLKLLRILENFQSFYSSVFVSQSYQRKI